jgi:hypothetical protein
MHSTSAYADGNTSPARKRHIGIFCIGATSTSAIAAAGIVISTSTAAAYNFDGVVGGVPIYGNGPGSLSCISKEKSDGARIASKHYAAE